MTMQLGYLLLVTWFIYDQPPVSYQVPFYSLERCEAAREALFREAARLALLQDQRAAAEPVIPGSIRLSGPIRRDVSAVCVQQ